MRILVTNDDGVDAPGLHALTRALVDAGHDVFVAAPLTDMSGSGAGFGPAYAPDGVVLETVAVPEADGVPAFALDAPPGLAVLAANLGAFGDPPELVVSGINPGCNTGRAVLHSGTVGAALTAANFGLRGIAVSQDGGDPWLVDTAAHVAVAAVEWAAAQPPRTVLNVNVPNVKVDDLAGVREAPLATFGTVRSVVKANSGGRLHFDLVPTEERLAEGTDTMVVLDGYVAVTALVGPQAVDAGDAPSVLARSLVPWPDGADDH